VQMNNSSFKYELFFELSPDLLCVAGYDGYFKKINPAVSKLLGYSMEELYARPINDFVYQDDKDITSKVREELTKSKPLFNFENRYKTKGGEIVWLSWTSLPVDRDQLVFAIAKNITHKKRLEEERNAMLAKLTKVNHDLKQLTYTTSHDLRSPVNNLLSIFGLIDISKINDDETLELIEILRSAVENLKQTLNNYVDILSKKHAEHTNAEEVDLNESLNAVLQSINSLIQNSKATIHADFSKLNKITFNKPYMESVFLNLITNSIKYAQPGCLPVISIRSEKVNDINRLIIADNGIGFDMEKVKGKIFGLHQRFHNNTDSKGIGLYLVHNHVTSLGGQISVESKINEGTKFIISFKE
jgi:PAS domain S-box-containing protein